MPQPSPGRISPVLLGQDERVHHGEDAARPSCSGIANIYLSIYLSLSLSLS